MRFAAVLLAALPECAWQADRRARGAGGSLAARLLRRHRHLPDRKRQQWPHEFGSLVSFGRLVHRSVLGLRSQYSIQKLTIIKKLKMTRLYAFK